MISMPQPVNMFTAGLSEPLQTDVELQSQHSSKLP
jgi:hypothetical protein